VLFGFATQRAFADQTEFSVMLLEAAPATKRIAWVVSLTLQLAAALRVAAATSDETGVDFGGVRLYIHGVLDFQVGTN
jgi:hypothetical protein